MNRQRRLMPRATTLQGEPSAAPRSVKIWRGERGWTLPLREGNRYVVGRHDAADIVFDEGQVSRLHGVLCFDEGDWWFEDYGSEHGTTLRPQEEEERTLSPHLPERLGCGDVIELGNPESRLELLPHLEDPEELSGATCLSAAAQEFRRRLRLAAKTRMPVLLVGPSGAGKSWAAARVHQDSDATGPFVSLHCARLPSDESALHSELLGHLRGAVSGADAPRAGKLVAADGGTLFLDEVECLSEPAQGFLLDVLEGTGDLSPLGAKSQALHGPVFRLVSASKRPLGESPLRRDLAERLMEGHTWRLPTLDERVADIPGLMRLFAAEQETLLGLDTEVSDEAIELACATPWPGQLRQLRAAVITLLQLELAEGALSQQRPSRLILRGKALQEHLAQRGESWGERPTR
ncbi:MAG: sigma 54-interacting transcriptional regulator [Myxococcota bacterium]